MQEWREVWQIVCLSSVLCLQGCKPTQEEPTHPHDHEHEEGTGTPHDHEGTGTPHDHEGTGTPHDHEGTGTPHDHGGTGTSHPHGTDAEGSQTGTPHHHHPTDTPTETEPTPTPVASPTSIPTPDPADLDGDGVINELDCAPNDPLTYPGMQEVCDHNDDDCDNKVDEDPNVFWYPDNDHDFFRATSGEVEACHPPEETWLGVKKPTDCDDENGAIYPGAAELCDGQDHDCNGNPLPCNSTGDFSKPSLRDLFIPELGEGCILGETPDVLEVTCPAGSSAVFRLDLSSLDMISLEASIGCTSDGWQDGPPGVGMELGSGPGLYGPQNGYGFVLGAPTLEGSCDEGSAECPSITQDNAAILSGGSVGEGLQPTLNIDLTPEELVFMTGSGISLSWATDIIWAGDFGLRCAEAHCIFGSIDLKIQ